MAACPCGGGKYLKCCGRYHRGQWPPTPETLMRSRFSAFALGNVDYILATWLPATRPAALDLSDNPRWTRLVVEHASHRGDRGEVVFRAYFVEPNADLVAAEAAPQVMREHSLFKRVAQRWYYVGAQA